MCNFNAVNESVFNIILTDTQHRSSEHSCIDGGQIYRDTDNKILAIAIPTSQAGFEYFAAADVTAKLN
ncbi:MAG: hypothetical protein VB913_10740 [Rhodospirillales bacterium]|jgi:hypothetical protein